MSCLCTFKMPARFLAVPDPTHLDKFLVTVVFPKNKKKDAEQLACSRVRLSVAETSRLEQDERDRQQKVAQEYESQRLTRNVFTASLSHIAVPDDLAKQYRVFEASLDSSAVRVHTSTVPVGITCKMPLPPIRLSTL